MLVEALTASLPGILDRIDDDLFGLADRAGSDRLQTAYFEPKGLFGFLYWYVLYPIHSLIFSGMIRRVGQQAAELIPEARAAG